jgi:Retrotransposon gag protein
MNDLDQNLHGYVPFPQQSRYPGPDDIINDEPDLQETQNTRQEPPPDVLEHLYTQNHQQTNHETNFDAEVTNERKKDDKLKLAKPEPFDGKKENYPTFRRSFTAYIRNYQNQYSHVSAILFVLSYMTKGFAGEWANAKYDEYEDQAEYPTYKTFLSEIDATFRDQEGIEQKARRELDTLAQGTMPAEEFFTKFEHLMRKAKYHERQHKSILVDRLEQNVNWSIIDAIYMGTRPFTYQGWKEKILELDGLKRRRDEQKNRWRQRRPEGGQAERKQGNATSQRPSWRPSNTEPQVPIRKDGTGTTYGGAGLPMDIDRTNARRKGLCFKCGKPGLIKDCPNHNERPRQAEVRATSNDTESKLAAMMDQLECYRKEIAALKAEKEKKDF